MEMVIGGAFQGKETYAKMTYPKVEWKEAKDLDEDGLCRAQGVLGFQEYIRKILKEEKDLENLVLRLKKENPDVILVSEEVGYGIVPIDAFERKYREAVGRICTELAGYSKRVIRVVCGIGTVIKNG